MEILQTEKAKPIIIIPDFDEDEVNAANALADIRAANALANMGAANAAPARAASPVDDDEDQDAERGVRMTAAQRRAERREAQIAAHREALAREEAERARFRPPEVRAAPVVVPLAAPAVIVPPNPAVLAAAQAELAKIDPGQQNLTFWNLIASFKWHNASEGAISHKELTNIKNIIVGWIPLHKLLFQKKYEEIFVLTRDRLREDGMFDRNNIVTQSNIAKVVSHVIALGMESYNTLIEDLPFYQTLIEMQECQNMNEILPEEWQI